MRRISVLRVALTDLADDVESRWNTWRRRVRSNIKTRRRHPVGLVTIVPTPPGATAFTGSNGTIWFGLVALFLLMVGSGLTYLGYRRRQRFDG